MINGNTDGVKASILARMEEMQEMEFGKDTFAPIELLRMLAQFTALLGREISVYISRSGSILDVSIGNAATVSLANIHLRRSLDRLAGVRCIHTHPGGNSQLSDIDLQSLQRLKLDAMAALGVSAEGEPTALSVAYLDEALEGGKYTLLLTKPYVPARIPQANLMQQILDADKRICANTVTTKRDMERAIVIAIADSEDAPSLVELGALAHTAGALVVARIYQNRSKADSATYIGQGKAQEIALLVQSADVDLVILDDELSGAQVRNLEERIGCRVIDRTTLILDIFALRAKSREGKLQVELAQLRYQLPRLTGLGTVLSRLAGGIGTRGPGESKLEMDRRHIRRRLTDIERELMDVRRQRDTRRARRERNEVPVVAIVGYTNAGKSSLLNLLSGANVLAEDKLFATLDPITRRIVLPGGMECLLVDTVGFISKLPHDLVSAFQSTLEEALHADLLLIVQDVADAQFSAQQQVVDEVLTTLGAGDKPRLRVYNKIDLLPDLHVEKEDVVNFSARTGQGTNALLLAIETRIGSLRTEQVVQVPYARGDIVAYLHKYSRVLDTAYTQDGTQITAFIDNITLDRVSHMLTEN